jgi:hypothetical protein
MNIKHDAKLLHIGLYVVIAILAYLLIKIAIIDPREIRAEERYNQRESRLRMTNLKEAQILYQKRHGKYTDNLDSLITFIKTDRYVDSVMNAYDSLTRRPSNPFRPLSSGQFFPDSLYSTPRSGQNYIVQIDTTTTIDTVVNQRGNLLRVDTSVVIGVRYYIEDPDGYGTIGSIDSDNLKNTASWE